MGEIKFNTGDPTLKYRQNTSNSFCFSSLSSSFESTNQIKSANDISNRIKESLISQVGFGNSIDFANAVLNNQKIDIG